ncbi:putative retrotransposon Copia-like protein [Arabidopsis thaliana]|uniref:Retrotransposon Copia-like N-terminal domain-containing protein n=3 Tax=Arabidopsis TaxID=3701 RepID=A0A178WIK6_ARATH|nr:Retrotransposon Copia-like N-terminal [Arabidopsis thaliana x Arabidopsis arenosa]KAG7655051.1 Retrotransposon Copia-like N-terminal [Arabidopsis suecica]OAP17365.1 hypothetical protein AXX17_AT1G22250 [Arabidopsis thaliana]
MAESPTLDPESPYYLDPNYQSNENLPMAILSKSEDNYFMWKIDFVIFLQSKSKIGFIDGTIAKPEPSSPLYRPWETCNARVKSWMMSSLSEELRSYVTFSETAHKAWEDLRVEFVPSVDFKIYELRQRLAVLRQDGDSVGRYFAKFMRAWVELLEYDPVLPECCDCEIAKRAKEAREKDQRYAFLMGLDNGLSNVRTQIMLMNPLPSLHQAFVMLDQAESMMKSTGR